MSASVKFAGLLLTSRQTSKKLKDVSSDAVLSVSKVDSSDVWVREKLANDDVAIAYGTMHEL